MTFQEIVAQCIEAQQTAGKKDAPVAFVVRGKKGRRTSKSLFPNGPIGEIVADRVPGRGKRRLVVLFRADKVLEHIEWMLDRMQAEEEGQVMAELRVRLRHETTTQDQE